MTIVCVGARIDFGPAGAGLSRLIPQERDPPVLSRRSGTLPFNPAGAGPSHVIPQERDPPVLFFPYYLPAEVVLTVWIP